MNACQFLRIETASGIWKNELRSGVGASLWGILLLLLLCFGTIPAQAQTAYSLTVKAGPQRQSFEGFGVNSIGDWSSWDVTMRNQMADMVYRDLKMNVMRVWVTTTTGTMPNPPLVSVADMLSQFQTSYIASGFIADVKSRGITTLLLAPAQGAGAQPPASVSAYAANLAELIFQLKNTYDIQIDLTGLSNEPSSWSGAQIVECINSLRSGLNSRGLTNVKIVAPESAGSHGSGVTQLDAMYADGTAWNNIYGIASHSYSPLTDREFENRKLKKPWWITEAGGDGYPDPEYPEDENYASFILEIFLGNLNHGVSEWLHFNGPKQVVNYFVKPGDPTHLVVADLNTRTIFASLKYYYFKQALAVFDKGAVFRQCLSASDGDMLKSAAGQNPAVSASAAYNPDGSWAVNMVNATGLMGTMVAIDSFFYPATTYNVTLTVQELAATPSTVFTVYRSRANHHFVNSGTVTLFNGVGTLSLAPKELVSLRSAATAAAIPPVPNGLTVSPVNGHLGLTWNNTVKATSWKVKRAASSGGPYTTVATTTATYYDDISAQNGVLYYYVVSAVNAMGESSNSSEILATPVSNPWTNTDIGSVADPGSCAVDDNLVFAAFGAGTGIGTAADSFNFTYQTMSGNGTLIARIAQRSQANTKVGIVMQETLGTSPRASMLIYNFNSAWNQVQMYNRSTPGALSSPNASSVTGNPMWLKLVRSGNTFTGYGSVNGTTWNLIGSATLAMGNSIYVGMAVCANGSSKIKAVFDNVSVPCAAPTGLTQSPTASGQIKIGWTSSYGAASYKVKRATASGGPYTTIANVTAPVLHYNDTGVSSGTNYYYVVSAVNPLGESADSGEFKAWFNADIGTTGMTGGCSILGDGTVSASGAGSNIGGLPDSFNFTYRSMTGNGTFIARLVSANVSSAINAKVGIMMCDGLGTSPKMVSVMRDFNGGYSCVRATARAADGAYTSWISSPVTAVPVWLKLVRSGSVFTAYGSSDGTTWTTISSSTIAMGSTIYVGLADCSRNPAQLCPAVFDNLQMY